MWNSKKFKLIITLTGHTSTVDALAIKPSKENIVYGSSDGNFGTIKVWNILNIDDEILDLKFSSNFHLLTSSRNGIIRLWNIYTCEIISEYINSNNKIRKHLLLDYFSDTGDLAYSEFRSINILNTGLLYYNVSNIN